MACNTLAQAANYLFDMRMSEFEYYTPETAAEMTAYVLMKRCLRGDPEAFQRLVDAADSVDYVDDDIFDDELTKSLKELAETL